MASCKLFWRAVCCRRWGRASSRNVLFVLVLVGVISTSSLLLLSNTGYEEPGPVVEGKSHHRLTQNSTEHPYLLQTTTLKPIEPFRRHGYELAKWTSSQCKNTSGRAGGTITVRWSRDNHVMDCPTYKIASTFWRRIFMIQREVKYRHLDNPYAIPFDRIYPSAKVAIGSADMSKTFKVMFTRDPYRRIYSAYVDKMVAPNPYFWRHIGIPIVNMLRPKAPPGSRRSCGHDISFPEFIQYIIRTMTSGKGVDDHFVEVTSNCRPCEVKYDFIGKMEYFRNDSLEVIRKLDLPRVETLMKKNGSVLAVLDSILDTTYQPFIYRRQYSRCISFDDALKRAWIKLRYRGFIGEQELNLTLSRREITQKEFTNLANNAYFNSEKVKREHLKEEAYRKAWKQVPLSDILSVQKIYANDFQYYDYDIAPKSIFDDRTS